MKDGRIFFVDHCESIQWLHSLSSRDMFLCYRSNSLYPVGGPEAYGQEQAYSGKLHRHGSTQSSFHWTHFSPLFSPENTIFPRLQAEVHQLCVEVRAQGTRTKLAAVSVLCNYTSLAKYMYQAKDILLRRRGHATPIVRHRNFSALLKIAT